MAHGPEAAEDSLPERFPGLQTPEGTCAELIEGEIVATPPPDGDHGDCIGRVVEQVVLHSAVRMRSAGDKGLRLSGGGRRPRDHAVPDAAFAPADTDVFRGAPPRMPPDGAAPVVEVTSARPERDRTAERHWHARAGIPLSLLVDRDLSRTTLVALPEGDECTGVHLAPSGKPLGLPAPFSFTLDTEGF
ncbi:Uma2 family endonuclease [Streptomyces sp. NPDC001380]|uniref:Uma2 family endonuclease n=1 Tax=Streptomyces sp. NPDC001380 TaxID=3364566 RepID=UPI0036AF0E8A